MSINEAFKYLDTFFNQFQSRIDTKKDLINKRCEIDAEKIDKRYGNEHEDNLNEQREILLNQLYEKRNDELEQVNKKFAILVKNLDNNDLVNKRKKLKLCSDYQLVTNNLRMKELVFRKPNSNSLSSILNLFKYENTFNYAKMIYYSDLIMTSNCKKSFEIDLTKDYDIEYASNDKQIFVLPPNKLFMVAINIKNGCKAKMLVINKKGTILCSKDLDYFYANSFKSNSTNIIRIFCQNSNEDIVEIYDFNLNLIHFFKLNERIRSFILTKDYFGSICFNKIVLFDLNSFKTSYTSIEINDENHPLYLNEDLDSLIHVNDSKLYVIANDGQDLNIIERKTGNRVGIIETGEYSQYFLRFDDESRIYSYLRKDKSINIYDQNGSFISKIKLLFNNDLFYSSWLTPINTIVHDKIKYLGNTLEYYEF